MQPINLKNLLSTACLIGLMNLLVPGVLLGAQSDGPIGKDFDLVRYVECLPTNVNAAFCASGSGNELKWPDAFTTMVYSLAVPEFLIDPELDFHKLRKGLTQVIVGIETKGAGISFGPFPIDDGGKVQSFASILIAREGFTGLSDVFAKIKTAGAKTVRHQDLEFLCVETADNDIANNKKISDLTDASPNHDLKKVVFFGNPVKGVFVCAHSQDAIVETMLALMGTRTGKGLTMPKNIRSRIAQSADCDWGFMFGDDSLQPPKYDGNDKSEPINFGDFAEFFSFVPNKDKPGHERLEIILFGDSEKLPAMCKYRWQWLQNFREDKMFSDSERDCVLFQIDMRLESIENQYRSRIEVYELFFLYGLGII